MSGPSGGVKQRPCEVVEKDPKALFGVSSETTRFDLMAMDTLVARGPSTVVNWQTRNEEQGRCLGGAKSLPDDIRRLFAPIEYSEYEAMVATWFTPIPDDIDALGYFGDSVITLPWGMDFDEQVDLGRGLWSSSPAKRYALTYAKARTLIGEAGGMREDIQRLDAAANHLFSLDVAHLLHQRRDFKVGSPEALMMLYAHTYLTPIEEADQTQGRKAPDDTSSFGSPPPVVDAVEETDSAGGFASVKDMARYLDEHESWPVLMYPDEIKGLVGRLEGEDERDRLHAAAQDHAARSIIMQGARWVDDLGVSRGGAAVYWAVPK